MMPVGLLPVAPRPFEDELLSSWRGRVACRYDLTEEGLSERLGVARVDRWIGFVGRDFAPTPAAVSAWARACRLSEERVRDMALSTRPRPVGLYVWGEGRVAGAIRRPVCPACLDEDADVGRDHHIRRSWALVESCLCDRHGRFLSETCAHCPSQMGFRFRNRGVARLVCVQCQGVVRSLETPGGVASPGVLGVFSDAVPRLRAGRGQPSFGGGRGAARRAAALGRASRAGRKRDPLHFARRVPRSLPASGRGGAGSERAAGHGVPGLADGDVAWRGATPRSWRRGAGFWSCAVHARTTGGVDGRGRFATGPFSSLCRLRSRSLG